MWPDRLNPYFVLFFRPRQRRFLLRHTSRSLVCCWAFYLPFHRLRSAAFILSFMADAPSGWFPALTLLVGFGVKSVSDWFQDRRALRREREARTEARRDQLRERRSDFQRQTLLDLQEAASDLIRACGAIYVQNVAAFRQTGLWR
jgi:hypothetical protein